MLKFIKIILPAVTALHIFGCNNSAILNPSTGQLSVKEITSVTSGSFRISLYVSGQDSLNTGYNEVYFKAWNGSSELRNGHISFFPKMWMSPTFEHSTPASDKFLFDSGTEYFRGYVIFNMPTSPPDVIWWAFLKYYDESSNVTVFDSAALYVSYHIERQWQYFYDSTEQKTYMLTLLEPFISVKGINDFSLMLHKTDAHVYYHEQINNADMKIKVFKFGTDTVSSDNVNPLPSAEGIYRGKINLPDSGQWHIIDTIKYQNRYITNNPPPFPEFYFIIP